MGANLVQLRYRGKDIAVRLEAEAGLSLWVDGCLRKQRPVADRVYLWTNIELEWEEHHYVEVYFHGETGGMKITANGNTLHDTQTGSG